MRIIVCHLRINCVFFSFIMQCSSYRRLTNGVWIGLRLNTSSPGGVYTWTDGTTYKPQTDEYPYLKDMPCVKLNYIYLNIGTLDCMETRHLLCEIIGNLLFFQFI